MHVKWFAAGPLVAAFPNVKSWYLRIAERPAVRRGYPIPSKVAELPIPK